jgi:hypothetical protein
MRFIVHAVSPAEFTSWLARTQANGSGLGAGAYSDLANPSSNVAPQTYRNVDPALLGRIVESTAQPFPQVHGKN